MSSLTSQVEYLTKSIPASAVMLPWFNAGIRDIAARLEKINPALLLSFLTTKSVGDDNGVDITDNTKIHLVDRNGYEASEVSGGMRNQLVDSNSLYYATKKNPKFFRLYSTGASVEVTTAIYFGDSATDGTIRIRQSGGDMVVEKRVDGSYVEIYKVEG